MEAEPGPAVPPETPRRDPPGSLVWRRNLYVCLFGSFTTLAALTLILPFLPLYVAELGAGSQAAVVQLSGVAYGATFFGAGLMAPVWGRLADRYGRKLILVRAAMGIALTTVLMGLVQSVWQLVLLRLIAGVLGGYASAALVLVATQTPKHRAAWALGTLSTGVMAGSLIGPLIGGLLPSLIGLRQTFFLAGGVVFVAFIASCLLIREAARPPPARHAGRRRGGWAMVPDRRPVLAMLATALLLMIANMSIEPIITVYVGPLVQGHDVAMMAGLVMSAAALGSILAAPRLGRVADRVGAWTVIIACLAVSGLLLIPQAFVTNAWQLLALRLLMGMSLGGLLPSINALIRHSVPEAVAGTMLGYSVSAQFAGQVIGPLLGGFVGGRLGMRPVFLATAVLMFAGAAWNRALQRRLAPRSIWTSDSRAR
ncbi:MAG: MFS transporter [Acidisphaera sp.]|nr:MFS transporter [Acidisphaera sp.]